MPAPSNDALGALREAYAFADVPALELGALVLDSAAHPEAPVRVPLSMLNRHGLVAGATGTGKTKTLQLIAEQLSEAGVPVFLADIKGDVSGLGAPGVPGDRVTRRAAETGTDWQPRGFPCEFLALGGLGTGVPVRATVTSFGPVLLSKVLGLNETQESSLGLVFHYADKAGLPLLDLKDLRAVITHLTGEEGKRDLEGLGGLSKATAGVVLRELVTLESSGGDVFFGEPEFDTADLLRTTPDGRGVLSVMGLAALQDRPQLFSTFLMWLLADVKGDLSGLARPGEAGDRVTRRAADTADDWTPTGFPVEFLALGGLGTGVPLRATVTSFGPLLLSKVMDLNATQSSSLGLVFHYADSAGLPLLDLKDLRAVISWLTSDEGKPELEQLGGLSRATAGVILRELITLEDGGGDVFFGEPEWDTTDLLRTAPDGRGVDRKSVV